MVHLPTGIFRTHPGPLAGIDRAALEQCWRAEIEAELRLRGPTRE
jgi:hypothetical protein